METSSCGIFALIDWFTIVFEGKSINNIIDWLAPDLMDYQDDFLANSFERASGFDRSVIYDFNGVQFQASEFEVGQCLEGLSVFDRPFSKLRLDISGSGLHFLRSFRKDIYVDDLLRDFSSTPQPSHVTRCDFAFDFIDYKPSLLSDLISFCREHHTEAGRLLAMHKTSLTYEIREGSGSTLYLGSTKSNKRLRIYDKYEEQSRKNPGQDWLYSPSSSWIRIEWQTRHEAAMDLVYSVGELNSVLKKIWEDYRLADPDTTKQDRTPLLLWDDLFDCGGIASLVQTIHFGQVVFDPAERSANYVKNIIPAIILASIHFRKFGSSLSSEVSKYLESLYDWQNPKTGSRNVRRLRSLTNKLYSSGWDSTQEDVLYQVNGQLFLKNL